MNIDLNSIDKVAVSLDKTDKNSHATTVDFRKVKVLKQVAEGITVANWKQADHYLEKLSTQDKYKILPGINASERDRVVSELKSLVDNRIQTDVFFNYDSNNKVIVYNI